MSNTQDDALLIILKTSYDIEGEKKEQMYRELAEMREKRHEENETA
jgi:hypothetical protein